MTRTARLRTANVVAILQMMAPSLADVVDATQPGVQNPLVQDALLNFTRSPNAMLAYLATNVLSKQGFPMARSEVKDKEQWAFTTVRWYQAVQALINDDALSSSFTEALSTAASWWQPKAALTNERIEFSSPRRKRSAQPASAFDAVNADMDITPLRPTTAYAFTTSNETRYRVRWPRSEPLTTADTIERTKKLNSILQPENDGVLKYHTEDEFLAYDCTNPTQMETITVPQRPRCDKRAAQSIITKRRNATYALLQFTPLQRMPIRSCERRRTRIPSQCGGFDHMTFITSDMRVQSMQPIMIHECRRMWADKEVTIRSNPHGAAVISRTFPLEVPGTTELYYDSHGRVWFHDNKEVECEGVGWVSKDLGVMKGVVQFVSDHITLKEDTLEVQADGSMILVKEQQVLHSCNPHQGRCVNQGVTYIWHPPREEVACPFYQTRTLHGEEITIVNEDDQGSTTIFDDDASMVRLIKRDKQMNCGGLMFGTNFDRLFLVPLGSDHPPLPTIFQRELPAYARELTLYFNQQHGWLHGQFSGRLHDYIHTLMERQCRFNQQQRVVQYAELAASQGAAVNGKTVALGKGRFATATGEAWVQYTCRPTTVFGANRPQCYNNLPITLRTTDEYIIRTALNITNPPLGFFLEPTTRIIKTDASVTPCSPQYANLYQNTKEEWIQATPALLPARAPAVLPLVPDSPHTTHLRKLLIGPNFQQGGIYTSKQLEGINHFQRLNTVKDRVLTKLVYEANEMETPEQTLGQNLFHSVGIPDINIFKRISNSPIWQGLVEFGSVAAALAALYCIYLGIIAVIKFCYRFFFPEHGFGSCCARVLGGLFPYCTRMLFEATARKGRRRTRRRRERQRPKQYITIRPREPPSDTVDESLITGDDEPIYAQPRRDPEVSHSYTYVPSPRPIPPPRNFRLADLPIIRETADATKTDTAIQEGDGRTVGIWEPREGDIAESTNDRPHVPGVRQIPFQEHDQQLSRGVTSTGGQDLATLPISDDSKILLTSTRHDSPYPVSFSTLRRQLEGLQPTAPQAETTFSITREGRLPLDHPLPANNDPGVQDLSEGSDVASQTRRTRNGDNE